MRPAGNKVVGRLGEADIGQYILSKRYKMLFYSSSIISVAALATIAFFIPRENFAWLLIIYSVAFGCFLYQVKDDSFPREKLLLGITIKVMLLFVLPALSQDYFRFIWDGNLLLQHINPYAQLPVNMVHDAAIQFPNKVLLYEKMGNLSSTNYSNYPPFNQVLFAIGAWLGRGSILGTVIVFKTMILAADILIFFVGKKLLVQLKLPAKNIFFYFLNPLLLVELNANSHFEAVMIALFLLSFYLLSRQKYISAGMAMAASVFTKLVPLMMLPFLIRTLRVKKLLILYVSIGISLMLLLFMFFSKSLSQHYGATLKLWFVNFEFNASAYYLVRAIGFKLTGYNIINVAGPALVLFSTLLILWMALRKRYYTAGELFAPILIGLTFYFLLSTTVHPWYITTLVALSVFTRYRYPLLWSFTIIFSYHAYASPQFAENYWWLIAEYVLVYLLIIYEMGKFSKVRKLAC